MDTGGSISLRNTHKKVCVESNSNMKTEDKESQCNLTKEHQKNRGGKTIGLKPEAKVLCF